MKRNKQTKKYLVGESSGNWGVIASVRFSPKLSKEEILLYYQKARVFKYPKGGKRGVEPEIYFQDEFQKVEIPKGYIYRAKDGGKTAIKKLFR